MLSRKEIHWSALISAIFISIQPSFSFVLPKTACSTFSGRRRLYSRHASAAKSEHEDACLSQDLIQGLDLIPLMYDVAAHACTRRGRQSLLSLVGKEERDPFMSVEASSVSSRARRVSSNALFQRPVRTSSSRNAELAPIASSASEAREEYELVEQALLALGGYNELSYPPIYGANSSPFDTKTFPDSDYDDWLYLPGDQLSLDHILQAEQVINTLLRVKEWSCQIETETWTPLLSNIGKSIRDDLLFPVQQELDGAVEIVRVKSLTDPSGRSVSRRLSSSGTGRCYRQRDAHIIALVHRRFALG